MKRIAPSQVKEQAISELLSGTREPLEGQGLVSELVRLSTEQVIQQLLEHEQQKHLGRERYQRGSSGTHRNGYEDGTLRTAEGVVALKLPQVRGEGAPYRSKIWSRLSKNSEALENIINEMWVRGLSVRDIEDAMTAATGAFVLSNSSVSQVTEKLVEQYEEFRNRDLGDFDIAYFFVDAVYEPLRRFGASTAVLCAWGISVEGSRILLSLTTGTGESFETCLDFLRDLVRRGLRTPLTVTTDGAPGLIKAVEALWPKSKRIRCWFHKMQNLMGKVPPPAWAEFKALVEDVRDAPDLEEAKRRMLKIEETYSAMLPEACRCLRDDLEASLNHLLVPRRHRKMVRTTNLVERSFAEERRRTKTIPHLWEEKSLVKLVFATLARVSERWNSNSVIFSVVEKMQIRKLRKEFGLEVYPEREEQPRKKRRSASRVAA
jgi:transposase-like protein